MSRALINAMLAGSDELNRMQSETDRIVRMMLGFIQNIPGWHDRLKEFGSLRAGSCSWEFKVRTKRLYVFCVTDAPMGGWIYCYSSGLEMPTYVNHIQDDFFGCVKWAWENLPLFIDGLLGVFPELKSKVETLQTLAKTT